MSDDPYVPPSSPLKYPGGKHYLADDIIGLMPRHTHYVETHFGGGHVLLQKNPCDPTTFWGTASYEQGCSEVANDIWKELTNFWQVLQDPPAFEAFKRRVEVTPFSSWEWREAEARQHPVELLDVEAAVAFFIRGRQSRAGDFKTPAPLSRNRTRRQQNEQASAWWNCVDGLSAVHARVKRVVILNQDAIDVIQQQDGEKTCFYVDPPYLHATRTSTAVYAHEMSDEDHRQLLYTLRQCRGSVLLSGYPNDLYDRELSSWNRHEFEIDNKASAASTKRIMTEVVWTNF